MYWEFLSRSYYKKRDLSIYIDVKYLEKEVVEIIPFGNPVPSNEIEITYMINKEDVET